MSGQEQHSAGLQECLELLRGPTDERRFVGLLLVTRILSSGDLPVIKAVYDAVGSHFISRLLLPLGRHKETASEQAVSTCSLALAMLSSFSRVPELASSQDLREKVPVLVQVVKRGGITGSLSREESPASAEPSVDYDAVRDSLDCLAGIAAFSQEGARVGIKSNALPAACSALQEGSARKDIYQQALAVRLLRTLLESHTHPDEPLLKCPLGRWADALMPGVAALAELLVMDTSAPSQAKGKQAMGQGPRGQVDQAALQLEAAYLLLFVLDNMSPEIEGELARAARAGLASGCSWLLRARAGLCQLLRARVAPAQRQATLQLCAALSAVGGPHWLLASSRNVGDSPETFFRLLVESLKVEAMIGLRDAMEPENPVPVPAHATTPSAESSPPDASGTAVESARDADNTTYAPADFSMLPPLNRPKTLVDEEGNDLPSTKTAHPQHDSGPAHHAGHTERAGERAARVLPAVFTAAETCIEALAIDTARADAAEEGKDADNRSADAMPVLSDSVKGRAMASLQEACDAILQYLESKPEVDKGFMNAEEGGLLLVPMPPEEPLVVASIRCLGRFLAEVPQAFSHRVQKLLPFLMDVRGGEGVPFLLPALLQVLDWESPDAEGLADWVAALLQKEAAPVHAIYEHARRAARRALCFAERVMEATHDAGPASHMAYHGISESITASERDMLMACDVLSDIFEAMRRSGNGQGLAQLSPQYPVALVREIARWSDVRQGRRPGSSSLIPADPLLVQRAAGLVAQVLLQRQNRSRLGESTGDVARCITWAVDEGYMRCIISKGLALRHAQDKLASSSLSDSIPDLGFNLQPPGEAGAEEEEDWLLDAKPLWQDTIRTATRLAAQWEPFRQALKSNPKVKLWLADSDGPTQGQTHIDELRPLLKAIAES